MPFHLTGILSTISKLIWQTDTDWNKGSVPGTMEVSGTGNSALLRLAEKSDSNDNITYTTAGNYTLSDGAKLEITADVARLKAITGSSTDYPFTTSGNYTFDSGVIEVTGGVSKLIGSDDLLVDLEAYYKMDEASWDGTPAEVTDSSLNTNDGTATGNATTAAGGKIGRAGTFDGNDDSVAIPHDATLSFETTDPFSFQCWVKVGSGGNRSLISKQQVSGSYGINMQVLTAGTIRMNLIGSTGSLAVDSTNTVDDDSYHHIVVTYDGNEVAAGLKTYIDGSLETPIIVVDSLSGSIVTAVDFRLGNRENSDQDYDGLLDEVGIWNRELTSGNVTSLYNSDSGLALEFYSLDDPTIEPNTGFVFSSALNAFTETATKTDSEIKYQVSSDDGTTWKWWSGAAWVERTNISVITAVNTTTGTVDAGNLASLQTLDGSTYDVSELAANPGFVIEMDMSNVAPAGPDNVIIHGYYTGNHTNVDVDIWDFNSSSWVTLGQLATGGGSVVEQSYAVTGSKSDKVEAGVVNIRINHDEMGTPTHDIFLDYVYIDALPSNEWWYDNETNTAATVNTNIGSLAVSGTFTFIAFLHSNDSSSTPLLNNILITEPVTYSTDDNLYIDTKDASQVAPASISDWLTTVITDTIPANTDDRVLFSTDGRVSWQTYTGGSWQAPASATTRTDATSIADAQTNFSSLGLGSSTLDVRLFLYTSDDSVRPIVSNIYVTFDAGYETSGTYETNIVDSTYLSLDWKTVSFVQTTPSGTSITIKAKASNNSGTMGSYGSALTNQTDVGVSGQYIQFEVTMAGVPAERPDINSLAVTYTPPTTQDINP